MEDWSEASREQLTVVPVQEGPREMAHGGSVEWFTGLQVEVDRPAVCGAPSLSALMSTQGIHRIEESVDEVSLLFGVQRLPVQGYRIKRRVTFGPSGFRPAPLDRLDAELVYASIAPPRMRFPASQVIEYPRDVVDPLGLSQVGIPGDSLLVASLALPLGMVTHKVKILPTLLRSLVSQSVGHLFRRTRGQEGSKYSPCSPWLPTCNIYTTETVLVPIEVLECDLVQEIWLFVCNRWVRRPQVFLRQDFIRRFRLRLLTDCSAIFLTVDGQDYRVPTTPCNLYKNH